MGAVVWMHNIPSIYPILMRILKFEEKNVLCWGGITPYGQPLCWKKYFDGPYRAEILGLIVIIQLLSCVQLCNPMDCSPPGSFVHGISQARILEWVVISFSKGSFWPRDQTHVCCLGRQILYHWAAKEVLALIWIFYMLRAILFA